MHTPIVGVREIANHLGVTPARVTQLTKRADFPAPYARLASGPVWKREPILRWVAKWDRTPHRRPMYAEPPS
jgi:hypothetical protein